MHFESTAVWDRHYSVCVCVCVYLHMSSGEQWVLGGMLCVDVEG